MHMYNPTHAIRGKADLLTGAKLPRATRKAMSLHSSRAVSLAQDIAKMLAAGILAGGIWYLALVIGASRLTTATPQPPALHASAAHRAI